MQYLKICMKQQHGNKKVSNSKTVMKRQTKTQKEVAGNISKRKK